MSASTTVSVILVIVMLLILIGYIIAMFEFAKNKSFIFAPYKPTPRLEKYFYPLNGVTPLTQEEIDKRNELIHRVLEGEVPSVF